MGLSLRIHNVKVLHCCYRYFPDRGGSETYISELAAGLQRRNVENLVVSATDPTEQYEHAGIRVVRLGCSITDFPIRLAALLDAERPALMHLHVRSEIWCNLATQVAKSRGIPCLLTYHIATTSCPRGDLMLHGGTVCDGRLWTRRCTACAATALGMPLAVATMLAVIPPRLARALQSLPQGRVRTALTLSSQVEQCTSSTIDYLHSCSRIIVLAEWSRQLLLRNGIAPDRIVLSRLGTHHVPPAKTMSCRSAVKLRGIFVGRIDRTKGFDVITRALEICQDLPLQIDAFGPLGADAAQPTGSAQLSFRGLLPDAQVVSTMSTYDFAVVPSQVPETGPFTVIEALQAGLPVIASDMPAINELLTHEVNGLIVAPTSVNSWAQAFRRLCAEPALLPALRLAAGYTRTMQDVADEMHAIYESVLSEKHL